MGLSLSCPVLRPGGGQADHSENPGEAAEQEVWSLGLLV